MPSTTISNIKPTTEKAKVALDLDRISVARKYRDRILETELGVERFIQEYEGNYDVRLGGIQVPPINDVFAYTQASIAGLIFKDPYIAVNAKKNSSILGARILEQAVNYYWRLLKTKDELELEIMDCILAGHAWHKVGSITKTIGNGAAIKISDEKLYSDRVSWRDMVFNIGSRRPPNDCQWMAQRVVKPTQDVKDQYPGTSSIVGGPHPSLNKDEIKGSEFKDDINFSTLWEIWDIRNREVRLVCEGHDKYLKKTKWPSFLNEYPFKMLWFNSSPDKPYPIPDIKPWEPQILEKIKLLAMSLNHVKRNSRQLIIKSGAFKETELDKFEKGVDGAMISTDLAIGESVQPLAYPAQQVEIFPLMNILDQMANNINGQPAFDRGATATTKTRTLGELELIKSGGKSRTDRKVDRIETHIENISQTLIAFMQANFDMDTVVKITGQPPEEIIKAFGDHYDPITKSVTFTKEDIQGEYDVDVKAGSTLPLNKESRQAILQSVLESAEKLIAVPVLPPFIQVLIQEILDGYDIKALEVAFEAQSKQAQVMNAQSAQSKNVEDEKTQAEADKRAAQAKQISAETAIKTGEALHTAQQEGILPQAIELGRAMGQFPENS